VAARLRSSIGHQRRGLESRLAANRHRPLVDIGVRLVERDREAAGTVVGSAIAFRLFLFFVPLVLFIVGIAGFLSAWVARQDVEEVGITGRLATQIDTALTQSNGSRWLATGFGLLGIVTAGRTLGKVMAAASCLAWRLPVRAKAPVRLLGSVVGLVVGIGLVSVLVNRIRAEFGVAAAGVSFIVAIIVYTIAWLLQSLALPRPTADPGAVLPGALLVGVTIALMQAVSQLYLPGQFSKASDLYGSIGAGIVILGWFFIMGRVIVISLTVNAVVYERFGSISTAVFGLPVLRALPRRSPALRRYFALPDEDVGTNAPDIHSPE
jgi:uncharacterized BrkB/YihY/UPF0761 family membrane protein